MPVLSIVTGWVCLLIECAVFFFKQKTAYEVRISDWSSDVCSSDLRDRRLQAAEHEGHGEWQADAGQFLPSRGLAGPAQLHQFGWHGQQIGRASCRERVCQYV